MPEVSVVIVCMNRPDILYPCLDSLFAHTTVSYEVLVVAYRFSPENLAQLRINYPTIRVIVSDEIRGFSENNNLALLEARGQYCFVVNDDTLISMPVIDRLVEDLSRLPATAAAISPCIRFADGRIQTCGRTPWTPWRYAKHYLHLVDEGNIEGRWTCPPPDKGRGRGPLETSSCEAGTQETVGGAGVERSGTEFHRPSVFPSSDLFQTYTLNGACFLIKTAAFKKVGWFDERFFFTPEDIALGHALNEAGYTVWVDPSIDIIHLAGGSVSKMESAIKPARVRGSLLFYGEPLWLRCFIWCFEAMRAFKYLFLPRTKRNLLMAHTARNVMRTAFSKASPKELFIRFSHE